MEEYIVFSDYGQWDNVFLVTANNNKDAIDKVWRNYYTALNKELKAKNIKDYGSPCNEYGWKLATKREIRAISCKSLHKKNGVVSVLN